MLQVDQPRNTSTHKTKEGDWVREMDVFLVKNFLQAGWIHIDHLKGAQQQV